MMKNILRILFLTAILGGLKLFSNTVNAQPAVYFDFAGVCAGDPTQFTVDGVITNIPNVVSWNWDFGDGVFDNVMNPVHTYPGSGSYIAILQIIDIFNDTNSVSRLVQIRNLPVVNFYFDTPNCENDSVQFHSLAYVPAPQLGFIATWIWNWGDGTPNDTVNFPNDPNLKHRFPALGPYFVTLTAVDNYGCRNTGTSLVTLLPSPYANFSYDTYGLCEDQVVHFTDLSVPNGPGVISSYFWDFGDPASGVNNYSNIQNPTHTFLAAGLYNVTLVVENYNGCYDTIVKQINIHASPAVDFYHFHACLNDPVTFYPNTVVTNIGAIPSSGWYWDFGDGVNATGPNPTHIFNSTGVFTVTVQVTDTSGCVNSIQHDITINPLPVAQFSEMGAPLCSGSDVQFDEHSNVIGYVLEWTWDFGDGTPAVIIPQAGNPDVTHLFGGPGNYNVSLTILTSDSCTDFESHIVNILPNPIANFSVGTTTCEDADAEFHDLTQSNGGGSISSWNWDFGDPSSGLNNFSTEQNPVHVYANAGTYDVILNVTTSNGCTDSDTLSVTINAKPVVDFVTEHRCQNEAVQFDPAASMTPADIANWLWDFDDNGITSTMQSPTHVYNNPGDYDVTLTVIDINGCPNTITRTVHIVTEPTAGFTYDTPACKDHVVQFHNTSFASEGYVVKWLWDFGDGNTLTVNHPADPNITHTFASYGTFQVNLTIQTNDSCTNTIIIPVEIAANPLANFSWETACAGTPVQFHDLSQPGSGSNSERYWNFGDFPSGVNNTSMLTDPVHTFNNAGAYSVTLVSVNSGGCSDTVVKTVTVKSLPSFDFTVSGGCENDSSHFVTAISPTIVQTIHWDFGDGYTDDVAFDVYHIYDNTGSYEVSLTITDTAGCTNTKIHTVIVAFPPNALFTASQQKCANLPVSFDDISNTSSGSITTWVWDFGDGNTTTINSPASPDVNHIYAMGGTYSVLLHIYTSIGCEAEYSMDITVSNSPLANFNFENTCSQSATQFTDLSNLNGGTSIVQWDWNFGDPGSGNNNNSGLQNPQHIYNNPGNFIVELQVTNQDGCWDTLQNTITILPKPAVDFNYNQTCFGQATEFETNTTITQVGAVDIYDWNFGDGSAHGTDQDVTHIYAQSGNYVVVLSITDTSGCTNFISHNIVVHARPNALFTASAACQGSVTQFTDQSFIGNNEFIASRHWDFGETTMLNDTSNLLNPQWIYSNMGTYSVYLKVTSQYGCVDSIYQDVQVFGRPTAHFYYEAAPCDKGVVYFHDSSYAQYTYIYSREWQFEPGMYSTLPNPVHTFPYPDSCYVVSLKVTDLRGCADTTYDTVCVPQGFDFTFATTPTCYGDTTFFTPQILSPAADSLIFFNWNFGDPGSGLQNTSTKKFAQHLYSGPGYYTVVLTATDIFGCVDTKFIPLTIYALPSVELTGKTGLCDSTLYFTQISQANSGSIVQYVYQFGDGNSDTIVPPANANISHKYSQPGLYLVNLTVTNSHGCTQTVSDSMLVRPCINAIFSSIDTICQYYPIEFADSSFAGIPLTEWYWDFGDGTNTTYYTYTNPVIHEYDSAGFYSVKMRISTQIDGQTVSDSTVKTGVMVMPTPHADFNYGSTCVFSNIEFTNHTHLNNSFLQKYSWEFNDPKATNDTSDVKNPGYTYSVPGMYNVQLIAENTYGCSDTIQKTITVFSLPLADFEFTPVCAGAPTEFTDMSDSTAAPVNQWSWEFSGSGDVLGRSHEQNPSFTFELSDDYDVKLLVADTNGCLDSITQSVTAYSLPSAGFNQVENFNNKQGQVLFENLTTNAVEYYWDFGNGDESWGDNPVEVFANEGKYTITMIAISDHNCTDTIVGEYNFMIKGLWIPTAFAPENPHEEVHLFKPVGINLQEYQIEVFDRWGKLMWQSSKLDDKGQPVEGWNGNYNTKKAPQGVYTWKVMAIFKDGSIFNGENVGLKDNLPGGIKGTVMLLR